MLEHTHLAAEEKVQELRHVQQLEALLLAGIVIAQFLEVQPQGELEGAHLGLEQILKIMHSKNEGLVKEELKVVLVFSTSTPKWPSAGGQLQINNN